MKSININISRGYTYKFLSFTNQKYVFLNSSRADQGICRIYAVYMPYICRIYAVYMPYTGHM